MEFNFNFDFLGDGILAAHTTDEVADNTKKTMKKILPPVCVVSRPKFHKCFRMFGLRSGVADLPKIESGGAYHFITGGEQGAMVLLDIVLQACPVIDHLLIISWTCFEKDAQRLAELVESGVIRRLDLLIGDILPKTQKRATAVLSRLAAEHDNVRFQISACHAKVFAGMGGDFYFAVQCSANLSAHPRAEQGSIICMREIYELFTTNFEILFENERRAEK